MKKKQAKATALTYDERTQNAPKVSATGGGLVAENIIEKAKKENVPVQKDPSLAELLDTLHIHETIPPELYQAVAEVFAFIYQADQMMEKNN